MASTDQVIQSAGPQIALTSPLQPATERVGSRSILRWEIAFVAAALLVVCGHLLIKAGLNAVAASPSLGLGLKLAAILQQPLVWLGLGIYGLGTLCWMAAVAQTELSLLYPLTSLNYILVAFLSYFLFEESISWRRGAGIAAIAFGMVLLTRSQRGATAKS